VTNEEILRGALDRLVDYAEMAAEDADAMGWDKESVDGLVAAVEAGRHALEVTESRRDE
jgi:hypothetical protein